MKYLLIAAALLVVGYSLWAGARNLDAAMSISAFLALSLLFFAYLPQITKFKASAQGIEAETREVVVRAEATLTQLQELAALMGKIEISLLVRNGRVGGYPENEQEIFRKEILAVLERIGVSEAQRKDALSEVRRFVKFDYVSRILGHEIPSGLDEQQLRVWHSLRGRLDNPPTPNEVAAFLKQNSLLTPERNEWLTDYEHYLSNHTHRRPDQWLKEE